MPINARILKRIIVLFFGLLFSLNARPNKTDTTENTTNNETDLKSIFIKYYQERLSGNQSSLAQVKEIINSKITLINVEYYGFNGEVNTGQIFCNKAVAKELSLIFDEMFDLGFQFTSISPINEFNFDDNTSMSANNTSCFDYRPVVNGKSLSKHSWGLAIDLNPVQNPYIKGSQVLPTNADSKDSKGRIRTADMVGKQVIKIFQKYGWTWGGNWRSLKDYMHFEKQWKQVKAT